MGFGDKRPPFAPGVMGQQPNYPMFPNMPMGAMGGMGAMGAMGGMPGMAGMQPLAMQMGLFPQSRKNQVKEAEFAKGIFVYDFEECMTGEMIFKHFNDIKPVAVIKFPTTKQRFSKKFAFVYFKTPEDAREVKEVIEKDREEEEKAIAEKKPASFLNTLKNRHKIIKKAFKVAPLANNDYSKILLKPRYDKNAPGSNEVLKKIREEYFNDKNLEQEIKRIVAVNPEYRFNKVIIPKNPKNESEELPYARAYFDLYVRGQVD
jgi:hypothetical protein